MASLIDQILTDDEKALHAGTVLIDLTDPSTAPRLLFMIDHGIREGTSMTRLISRRMQFVEIDESGSVRHAGAAPYLSYENPPPETRAAIEQVLTQPWLTQDLSALALAWASEHLVKEHYEEVVVRRKALIKKTLEAVHQRLTREINYWSRRANELAAEVKAGKQPRMQPDNARKRADELKARLAQRRAELEGQLQISSNPPVLSGCALVIPQGLLASITGQATPLYEADPEARKRVELFRDECGHGGRAQARATKVKDVSREKCGWDVTAITPAGEPPHRVKGRYIDADTVVVTANEVLEALNQGSKFFLAIVQVEGEKVRGPHYIARPSPRNWKAPWSASTTPSKICSSAPKHRTWREESFSMSNHAPFPIVARRSSSKWRFRSMRSTRLRRAKSRSGMAIPRPCTCGGHGVRWRRRAVLFAQLVNDPSWKYSEEELKKPQVKGAITKKRNELFQLIGQLVQWENTNNEELLKKARAVIWESWRETCEANKHHPDAKTLFDPAKLPGFHDPFAGGGAIPLEAQRLGLVSHASDLNPVAVLINKAMIEIPPKFAGSRRSIRRLSASNGCLKTFRGAEGLAEDVRYYGQWMRDEAEKRIGHLYRQIEVTKELAKDRPDLQPLIGQKLTVIAWLWARTVASPNPAVGGAEVPLVSTYMLSTKPGKGILRSSRRGTRPLPLHCADRNSARCSVGQNGTKLSRGANFQCLLSRTAISGDYIKSEGMAGRMVPADGRRRRRPTRTDLSVTDRRAGVHRPARQANLAT